MEAIQTYGEDVSPKKSTTPWKIYIALTLSTWGDYMWLFAGGMFMMKLQPDSLRLTAAYGLVLAATVIIFGAPLGKWIDCTGRLKAAKVCLIIQNASVSICAVILSLWLHGKEEIRDDNWKCILSSATICFVIFFSSMAKLFSSGMGIVLQKDWIVVIADNDSDMLAKMNSTLRTIALVTQMLAPVSVGLFFTFLGYISTGIVVASWNIVSMAVEYSILHIIYKAYPKLQEKKAREDSSIGGLEPKFEAEKLVGTEENVTKRDEKSRNSGIQILCKAFDGWIVYFSHPVRNAGLGLALLYMTVLGFDNITYGFVLTQGIPEYVLGILVAVSAMFGVSGSLSYPFIKKAVGLERTGLFGMCLLVSLSSLAVVSIFLPGSPFLGGELEGLYKLQSVIVFLTGIIMARFGLWVTDLTINQILQERVEEGKRGVVNGVQVGLNNTLDLVKCVLVITLPNPSQFGYLIMLSFTSISLGWISYATYSRKQRGHLFHFCRFVEIKDSGKTKINMEV